MVELNCGVNESLADIWTIADAELVPPTRLLRTTETLAALHRLCDSIAFLDAMESFVSFNSMCPAPMLRTIFIEAGLIAPKMIIQSHFKFSRGLHVNDTFISETSALHIIVGRNKSGKSKYVRSVALLAILAHAGCQLPATFVSFRLLKNICIEFNTSEQITSPNSNARTRIHSARHV
jgi:DNA mismatch repair ATPase MutS